MLWRYPACCLLGCSGYFNIYGNDSTVNLILGDCLEEMKKNDMSTVNLILGDCLEEMKKIPDKSVDLILTDPPYGINFSSLGTKRKEKLKNDKFEDWQNMLEPMFQ